MKADKVNVLLVDDQPAKLLTYEAILRELDENLLTAENAREALELLLKNDVAVVLVDVYMPETDGFQLAEMIRDHPRFRRTAIIFISAVLLTDVDRLRGYEMGAVDYVPVPVIPEVLRAKVKIFVELYRKSRQLEQLNRELEARVADRTAELAASTARLLESERRRSVALEAGQMGAWDWDLNTGMCVWDAGQHRIFGVEPGSLDLSFENIRRSIHPEDLARIQSLLAEEHGDRQTFQTEARIIRPDGEIRWCICAAAMTTDQSGRVVRVSGVSIDITDRKEAEERQMLLAEEVDHRARNVVAVIQSIMRLTHADSIAGYIETVEGRIRALSNAHKLLAKSRWEGADLNRLVEEELSPYRTGDAERYSTSGPVVVLPPAKAQTIALALHELVTNAAKYGALSTDSGRVELTWRTSSGALDMKWAESGGPKIERPIKHGYGMRVITTGIERQLGGVVKFNWQSGGLQCALSIPHDLGAESMKRATVERMPARSNHARLVAADATRKHVLIVEDEPLVSMMLADMLSDFGHTIDGPYSRFDDALLAAKDNNIQAGILDINIGGQRVYALAEELATRKIPFVFMTGYSAESIDSRFTHVPVLQKPIEPEKLMAVLGTIDQP
jgi:PAS domain S-box-containing protein